MAKRTISNTGDPLESPSSVPYANARVRFTIVDATTHLPTDAWVVASGERVGGYAETTTDASGIFTDVALWPNDQLSPATIYLCQIDLAGFDDFYASVDTGATTLQWIDFKANGTPLTPAELSALQTHISDNSVHNPAPTAANDFVVGDGAGSWILKTLAQIKTILGLGSAAYTDASTYEIVSKKNASSGYAGTGVDWGVQLYNDSGTTLNRLKKTSAEATGRSWDFPAKDGTVALLDDISTAVADYVPLTQKAAANGVATLDANTLIPVTQIPKAAMPDYVVVADQAARYALTTAQVQNGDIVEQTSPSPAVFYYVKDDTNLGNAAGYAVYSAGVAAQVAWSGITDVPMSLDVAADAESDTKFPSVKSVVTYIAAQLSAFLGAVHVWTKAQRSAVVPLAIAAGVIDIDLTQGNDFSLVMTSAATLAAPTVPPVAGQDGTIDITTGSDPLFTLAFTNPPWQNEAALDAPALPTAIGVRVSLHYHVYSPTYIGYILTTHGN